MYIRELKTVVSNFMDIAAGLASFEGHIHNIKIFKQTWGSTALGFGGIGGSALTTAWTTVVEANSKDGKRVWYVFFDGELAYAVDNPTEAFLDDLKNESMADCDRAKKMY